IDNAVEEAMIRQLRRAELDGVTMRRGDKLQIERGDIDRDGDDDIAVLFSLINTGTETLTEDLVLLTYDGRGKLRHAADRIAGVDDQAQGTTWDLKGIAAGRLLVTVSTWGEEETSDGTTERRESSTVREFTLSGGQIADIQ